MSDFDQPRRFNRKLTEVGPRKSQRLSSLVGPAEIYRHGEIAARQSEKEKEGGGDKGEKSR